MSRASRILQIERHALAAWPAAEVEDDEGWQLRAMSGVTRRANSVWTARASGSTSSAQRITRAESFYRARALVPCFQVGPHSEPPTLDAELAARGYTCDAPVSVQVAMAADVARAGAAPGVRVEIADRLSDVWFDLSARAGRFAAVQDSYRGLLARLGTNARFALAFVDERPAGVGLGVCGDAWLGVSSMLTLPAFRKRGAASSMLRALASSARQSNLPTLYLQVEQDNAPAIAVYARAGFVPHHGYHYRVAAEPH